MVGEKVMFLTRRGFLKATLGGTALASFAPFVPEGLAGSVSGMVSEKGRPDRILVIVQLTGGNDGLNTVVPYADDAYAKNRPTLRLPTNELHRIDSYLGFHPRMAAFNRLYKEGHLTILQGVGTANPSGDHDTAMRAWHSADPDRANGQTGWIGRTADSFRDGNPTRVAAAFVGPITAPFALTAQDTFLPSVRTLNDLTIHEMPGHSGPMAVPKRQRTGDNPLLNFVQKGLSDAQENSRRLEAVAGQTDKPFPYPSFGLAENLRTVAQLIRADIGIRIFFTELGGGGIGGFDNHANQLGNHCALLHQLSESVAAFVDDLNRDGLLDRTLLMTFSEFGRTVQENGRRGTNHGNAAPMFLAGGKLKGGLVGQHPSLTDLDNDALKFHADFRQVYATVLDRWLGFESRKILGRQFEPLDVFSL
jgi:uncharacterized protein (DUF1501 family)